MTNELIGALGLCRKAGRLTMGFDAVCEDVYKGKAHAVFAARDLSPKTLKRLRESCEDLIEVRQLPLTLEELLPISRKPVGVYAVTDENLARLCVKKLEAQPQNLKEDVTNAKG